MEINIHGDVYINSPDEEEKERKVKTIRNSPSLATVKKKVKARDLCCQCCGEVDVNGHLECHHILPLARYKTLAADMNNIVSLCQSCHAKYHQLYKDNENAVTFAEFMKKYGNRRI